MKTKFWLKPHSYFCSLFQPKRILPIEWCKQKSMTLPAALWTAFSGFRNSTKLLQPKPPQLVSLEPSQLLVVPLVKGLDFAATNDEAMS
jgi:hypothetical protein